MLSVKRCLLALAFVGGQGACQKDIIGSVLTRFEGFTSLQHFISSAEALSASGQLRRESHPLSTPRIDYGITEQDIRYFLPHSVLGECTPEQVRGNTCYCKDKFHHPKLFRNNTLDSQAIAAVDSYNKLIVVSYRVMIDDSDYEGVLVNHPALRGKEKVHKGGLNFFNSIHPQMEPVVLTLLRNSKYKDYKLHLTGYSLGAAVAAISLPTWMKALKYYRIENKVQVYSYSGPRPGDVEFSRYLESIGVPIVRYAKRGDAVPMIPDQALGFAHVGQEFYDDAILIRRPLHKCRTDLVEDNRCSLSARKFYALNHITPLERPLPTPPLC